jgi:hypothetical protein
MKNSLLALLLIVTSNCFSQGIIRKTVPGTRLTIEAHEGSSVALHDPLMVIEDRVDLNIVEYNQKGMFNKFQTELLLPELTKQGFSVVDDKDISIDDFKGHLFIVEVGTDELGLSCYFGDSTFAVLCTAVYLKTDDLVRSKLLRAIQSIKVNKNTAVDWNSYFSFTYDQESLFKLDSSRNHNLGIRFTENGASNTKFFGSTNIICGQFTPDENVKNAQDITNSTLVASMAQYEIIDVMEDNRSELNGTDTHCFHALCSYEGQEFELYSVTLYHETSCVYATAYLINDHHFGEAKDFVNTIRLKKDQL